LRFAVLLLLGFALPWLLFRVYKKCRTQDLKHETLLPKPENDTPKDDYENTS